MNRVITISREFGSGGRTIGKLSAERLGIPCYDQELIEKIEEKSGLAKEYIAERGEYTLRMNATDVSPFGEIWRIILE